MRMKRLAAPNWWPIERKAKKFVFSPRGPYTLESSMPLAILVRGVLKLAETGREAKSLIKKGLVLVDGKPCRDQKFGIGLMNVIEIPSISKCFRAVSSKKGLKIIEAPKGESKLKLCKIINKTVLKKGKVQLNLHDGKNILADNNYKTNDSLLLELPDLKIKEHLKFEPESKVLIISGKNSGKTAKLRRIEILRSTQPNRIWLEDERGEFEAPFDFVMVIGKEKPVINLGEQE